MLIHRTTIKMFAVYIQIYTTSTEQQSDRDCECIKTRVLSSLCQLWRCGRE